MEHHYEAWKKSFLEYDVILSEKEYYPLEVAKLIKIAENILIKNKKSKIYADKIVKKKEIYYNKNIKIKFYQDVIKTVNFFKKSYLIGIVTATKRKTFIKTIPYSFKKKFDIIVTGDDTKRGKPSSEPYIYAANKLKVNYSECLVFENAPLGIKSAKKAKMNCIAIASTVKKHHLKEADIIINKFSDILNLSFVLK